MTKLPAKWYQLYDGDHYIGSIWAVSAYTLPEADPNSTRLSTGFLDHNNELIATIWNDGPRWEEAR